MALARHFGSGPFGCPFSELGHCGTRAQPAPASSANQPVSQSATEKSLPHSPFSLFLPRQKKFSASPPGTRGSLTLFPVKAASLFLLQTAPCSRCLLARWFRVPLSACSIPPRIAFYAELFLFIILARTCFLLCVSHALSQPWHTDCAGWWPFLLALLAYERRTCQQN